MEIRGVATDPGCKRMNGHGRALSARPYSKKKRPLNGGLGGGEKGAKVITIRAERDQRRSYNRAIE